MRVRAPYVALLAVLVVMLAPVVRDRDSYPGSTYPMFARDRGATSNVATVVGRADDGTVERLTPQLIGGTDEVVLAVETAARAVRAGGGRPVALCREVATRLARSRPGIVTVEVRVETHDAVAYFTDDRREPAAVDVRATCAVDR